MTPSIQKIAALLRLPAEIVLSVIPAPEPTKPDAQAAPQPALPQHWRDYIAAIGDRVQALTDVMGSAYLADGREIPECFAFPLISPAERQPRIITAEQRRDADAVCETYEAMWTPAERKAFRDMKADAGPVFYCPNCGRGSSGGPCGCGGSR